MISINSKPPATRHSLNITQALMHSCLDLGPQHRIDDSNVFIQRQQSAHPYSLLIFSSHYFPSYTPQSHRILPPVKLLLLSISTSTINAIPKVYTRTMRHRLLNTILPKSAVLYCMPAVTLTLPHLPFLSACSLTFVFAAEATAAVVGVNAEGEECEDDDGGDLGLHGDCWCW